MNNCNCNPCKKCNPCGGGCEPARYDCDFDIQSNPYDPTKWIVTSCGMSHEVSVPSMPCLDLVLSTDYANATLSLSGSEMCDTSTLTGEQIGEIIELDNLRDVEIDYTLDGNCYELIYHKNIECGEGCESPTDRWSNFNINSDGAKQEGLAYLRGAGEDGCPAYLAQPDCSCAILAWSPSCDNPSGKWEAYCIPDAEGCEVELNDNGYYEVLIKNDCGCPVECQLPVSALGASVVHYMRDSVPDDPDFPWYYGSYNETINLHLAENAPKYFGKYDLKVTVCYGVQALKGSHFSYNYNFRSIIAPVVNGESEYTAVQYAGSILQGAAATTTDIPWGTQSLRGMTVFIVPKGKEAYLHHEYRIITQASIDNYVAGGQSDLYFRTSVDGQQVPASDLATVDQIKFPASRLNGLSVLIEPVNGGVSDYKPSVDTVKSQLDAPNDAYPNPY